MVVSLSGRRPTLVRQANEEVVTGQLPTTDYRLLGGSMVYIFGKDT
jgi:hypothetical protein